MTTLCYDTLIKMLIKLLSFTAFYVIYIYVKYIYYMYLNISIYNKKQKYNIEYTYKTYHIFSTKFSTKKKLTKNDLKGSSRWFRDTGLKVRELFARDRLIRSRQIMSIPSRYVFSLEKRRAASILVRKSTARRNAPGN